MRASGRSLRRGLAPLVAALLVLTGCTVSTEPSPTPRVEHTPRPLPPPPDPIVQYAADQLRVMTLEQKIRSMLMVHRPGLDAAATGAFIVVEGLGGTILMGSNVPDPPSALAQTTSLLRAQPWLPALVAIDQEGGVVARVWTDDAPAAWQLRELAPAASREAFAVRGAMLHALGVSVNFGIVADVVADPASFIYDRSYGSVAAQAAPRVAEAVAGERGSVLSTLKHFPGHGAAPGDSHYGIPSTGITLEQWRTDHAPPFTAGIAAGAELVMMGHLRFDAVDPQPASLSATWVGLLRDELGFDGIIVTDDMTMLQNSGESDLADQAVNAVRAVAAGNTLLLYVGPVDVAAVVAAIAAAVQAGTIDEALIDDAARRLIELRRELSGQTGRFSHCFEECQQRIR